MTYQSAVFKPEVNYPLVCSKDRAARSQAEEIERNAGMAILGDTFEEMKTQAEKMVFTVDAVNLAEDGQTASVVLSSNLDGEVLGHPAVDLARTEEGWCVVTGWAEEARLESIAAEASAAAEGIEVLMDDYKLDEAAAKIAAARAMIASSIGWTRCTRRW